MAAAAKYDIPRKDGTTLRQHLAKAGQPPDDISPIGADHLLEWFWRLSARRSAGGFAPSPISFEAINAWSRLSGEAPEPWEVGVIELLDNAFLMAIGEAQKSQSANSE